MLPIHIDIDKYDWDTSTGPASSLSVTLTITFPEEWRDPSLRNADFGNPARPGTVEEKTAIVDRRTSGKVFQYIITRREASQSEESFHSPSGITIVRHLLLKPGHDLEMKFTSGVFEVFFSMTPKKYLNFMAFPGEIRNMIYELLLRADEPIEIVSPRGPGKRRKRLGKHFASLMSVCRDIGAEARTTFYGCNKWVVGNGPWGSQQDVNRHVSNPKAQLRVLAYYNCGH
ncbi:hypothetical protein ONS96_005396 [Cadophora gregata f. sp. sojae]|nr:hypothetical protein ONS96_005396 [Cadophora gregata f. sp. sojae]